MRHHRGADNAERQVQHLRVLHDLDGRREAQDHLTPIGVGHGDLDAEADGDDAEHGDNEGFDIAEAEPLHPQDEKHVERGEDDADLEWDAEQEIEPDRRADHLGEVGGADGKLGERPERIGDPAREGVAAGLRQVAARRHAEPRAERLQNDRHDVGEERDEQQRIAELGTARERCRPVAGVHIADGHQIAGTKKGDELPPGWTGWLRANGAKYLGERWCP